MHNGHAWAPDTVQWTDRQYSDNFIYKNIRQTLDIQIAIYVMWCDQAKWEWIHNGHVQYGQYRDILFVKISETDPWLYTDSVIVLSDTQDATRQSKKCIFC